MCLKIVGQNSRSKVVPVETIFARASLMKIISPMHGRSMSDEPTFRMKPSSGRRFSGNQPV